MRRELLPERKFKFCFCRFIASHYFQFAFGAGKALEFTAARGSRVKLTSSLNERT